MRTYNQGQPSLRWWFVTLAILIIVAGTFALVSSVAQDFQTVVLSVGGVLVVVAVVVAVRIFQIAVSRKRERQILGCIESMADSFMEMVGDQKRQFYFTAKKRFQAAARAIGASDRKARKLYLADLQRAKTLVLAGQYDASIAIFEALIKTASESRGPAYDALEMYMAVQRFSEQRARRKNKARAKRRRQ